MAELEAGCVTVVQSFFYSEEVFPPRCRNARYRKQLMKRAESIPKAGFDEAPVAFVVTEDGAAREIRAFGGNLYEKEAAFVGGGYFLRDFGPGWSEWVPSDEAGELEAFEAEEPDAGMPRRELYGSRGDQCRRATRWLKEHAAIGGELWTRCGEPSYSLNARGVFSIAPNGSFNALERDLAIKASKSRWERWYCAPSWSESLCDASAKKIDVLMPERVERPSHSEISEWKAASKAEGLLNSVALVYDEAGLEWPEGFKLFASYCDGRLDEIVREVASRLSCDDAESVARDMLLGARDA